MNLQAWWDSLDALTRILFMVAVPSTLLLVIQLILAVIGFSGIGAPDAPDVSGLDAGVPTDFSADAPDLNAAGFPDHDFTAQDVTTVNGHDPGIDAFRLFTLSGMVSFFVVFSWSSIFLRLAGIPGALAVVIGLVPGCAAMYLVAKIYQLSRRLTESGNMNLENAIDLVARVYIPIPGARGGEGKVTLVLQGTFVELNAVTDEPDRIPSGTSVVVVGVKNDVLIVARDTSEEET